MSAWWGTHQEVSPRLRLEVEAMKASFGKTFRLNVPTNNLLLYWQGAVILNMTTIPHPQHTLKIVYPQDYPYAPAEAYVLHPTIESPIHQYKDGQLCLFNPKDGTNYGWNPSKGTAVTVTSWAIQWLYADYTWRITREWPGEEERITQSDV